MNHRAALPTTLRNKNFRSEQAAIRPAILSVVTLAAGLIVGGIVWLRKTPGATTAEVVAVSENSGNSGLSDATRAVLARLNVPVEIRFYSALNDSEATAPRRGYEGRVGQLLAEYERVGAGNIIVKRFGASAETAKAAAADGLEPLRLGKAGDNYFGLAVASEGQKAVLSNLAPEWEAALEFDLSRAIARVASGASGPGETVMNPQPTDAVSTEELLAVIPDVEELPLAEATQKMKAAGLDEFKTVAAEIRAQIAEAHQRLADAQKAGPEAEQAARKKIEQLQVEQNEKLGEISRRMQGRLTALQQLKRSAP